MLVAILTAVVAIPVVHDLQAARGLLEAPADELVRADVARAQDRLERVSGRLSGPPARLLGLVPVVGPSLGAVRAVAQAARPVLAAGLELKEEVDRLRSRGLMEEGRIQVEDIEALQGPVHAEVEALERLEKDLADRRNGWVAPPVWDALEEMGEKVADVRAGARGFEDLLGVIGDLLGGDQPRTYLVMLLNNAELRGAGGVLTGLGTVTVDDGRIRLGRFFAYEDLREDPYRSVPAPADYENHYAHFGANTTIFVNATYSPDVPDDALVAARLFHKVTGISTDGALVVDPRGLAALLPEGDRVRVPGLRRAVTADELPKFVYSDAYKIFDSNVERRAAILELGAQAFRDIVSSNSVDSATTEAGGAAFASGHLRFVSFHPSEQAALDALNSSGDLQSTTRDGVVVAGQNLGGSDGAGTKLDYWVDRAIEHRCTVVDDGSAQCSSEVTLTNRVPDGLTRYVAGQPYGLLRTYLEIFVPENALVDGVTVDGEEPVFYTETEEGWTSFSASVNVPQGASKKMLITYSLPANASGYSFRASPQPLAHDARLRVRMSFPLDWIIDSPGHVEDGFIDYSGEFTSDFELRAHPDERTGVPALWDSLGDFWREPLF